MRLTPISEHAYATKHSGSLLYLAAGEVVANRPGRVFDVEKGRDIPTGQGGHVQYVLEIKNATVAYPNVVVSDGVLVDANNGYASSELAAHSLDGYPLLQRPDGSWWLDGRETRHRLKGEHAYIALLPNYAAFLLGELPRVGLYREALDPGFRLIAHGSMQPFHRELLSLAGVDVEDIVSVPADQQLQVDALMHASPTFFHHYVSSFARGFIRGLLPAGGANPAGKVYLSRSRLGTEGDRPIRNEAALEDLLRRRGFAIVHPQELPVREQLQLFSSMRSVVAPFGALWANAAAAAAPLSSLMLATKFTPEFGRLYRDMGLDLAVMIMEGRRFRAGANYSQSHEFHFSETQLAAIGKFLDDAG